MAAAAAAPDLSQRISWLETARAYDSGRTSLRALAVAYGEKAQYADSSVVQQAALRQAEELYRQLCADMYATSHDRLNYSVVLRMLGQEAQACQILKDGLQYDPGNYRLMASLCFLYYEQGDSSNASVYCRDALALWRADTSQNRLEESEEEIQNLLEIGRRFGIGGTK